MLIVGIYYRARTFYLGCLDLNQLYAANRFIDKTGKEDQSYTERKKNHTKWTGVSVSF
jgi:hypothetical protein